MPIAEAKKQYENVVRRELLNELGNYLLSKYGVVYDEHQFHPKRKWRFDFAVPSERIAVEVEGAIYQNGRHTRGSGYQADLEKYNTANLLGWKVFRFSYDDLKYRTYQKFI